MREFQVFRVARTSGCVGMSLYCWAPQGKKFFNTTAIGHLAHDWKCTVIRIAVLPRDCKNNPTDELNRVKTVIDACIENGIYAIIDWHSMEIGRAHV